MMPIMGGADFMERFRADAQFEEVPVLLVTAWPKEAVAVPGAQGVLTKPLEVGELFEQVGRVLGPVERQDRDH